jgi:hypothetical protein
MPPPRLGEHHASVFRSLGLEAPARGDDARGADLSPGGARGDGA